MTLKSCVMVMMTVREGGERRRVALIIRRYRGREEGDVGQQEEEVQLCLPVAP